MPGPTAGGSPLAPRTPAPGLAASALALVLAVAVAYANSLHVPFQFDDAVVILGEPAVTTFHPDLASRRYLGDLSLALSYRLSGERPLGYHLVNVGIHLASSLLVLALVRSLLRAPLLRRGQPPGRDAAVPLLAALLFALHPLQTQAVTYIAQRYASLAAAFFLLACVAYVRTRSASGRRVLGWYAVFLLSAGAAFWTKENTYVLPLAVLLLELACFPGPARRRLLFLAPLLAGGAAVALKLASGVSLQALDAATRVDTDLPRLDYALTQLRVVAAYLRLLALPLGQNLDHDVVLSRSALEPAVLAAAALHAALVVGAVLAIVRGRRRADPLLALAGVGVLWFYATLLVESSLIPIVDPMYEHRVYLPSAGAFTAVAALLGRLPALSTRRAWIAAALALALPLAALTVARNRVWRSDLSLWTDAAAGSPRKARPLNNVGCALFDRGDVRGALAWYGRALDADPGYVKAWFNAGEALQALGDCPRAIPAYERFLAARPEYPETYLNLASCYERLGRGDVAARLRAAHAELVRRNAGAPLPTALR